MIARITILWLKKGCRYETWLAYKNFFLMNVLQITPIQLKQFTQECSTAEELFIKCQPKISEFFCMQESFDSTPNLLGNLAEQMAAHISEKNVSEGAQELIILLLLLSHNFYLFKSSLANLLISYFFQAIQNQRKSYEVEKALQVKLEK